MTVDLDTRPLPYLPDLPLLGDLDPYGDLPQSWTSDEPPGGGVVFCSAI